VLLAHTYAKFSIKSAIWTTNVLAKLFDENAIWTSLYCSVDKIFVTEHISNTQSLRMDFLIKRKHLLSINYKKKENKKQNLCNYIVIFRRKIIDFYFLLVIIYIYVYHPFLGLWKKSGINIHFFFLPLTFEIDFSHIIFSRF